MSRFTQKEPVAIISSKNVNGTTCYKVKWAHGNQLTETWEPVSALFDYMYLVADYEINGCQEKVPRASTKPKQLKLKKLTTI